MAIDYDFFARKIIQKMVSRILNERIIDKTISYSELAQTINFPPPYTGSQFSRNIGRALGAVGHLLEKVKTQNHTSSIPVLQSMIVKKKSRLPSFGLRAFVDGYDKFPPNEQRAFVLAEYEKILSFGERWLDVLRELQIEYEGSTDLSQKAKLYNPFGSEGSPEHKNVKNYIKEKHHLFGYLGTETGIEEYPLRSGDKIDVVFRDGDTVYAYEAKSIRSNLDDIERGIFQCVKYKKVIEAETKVGVRNTTKVICSLVTETELPKQLQRYCEILGIKYYTAKINKT